MTNRKNEVRQKVVEFALRNGICTKCFARYTSDGYKYCETCRIQYNSYRKRRFEQNPNLCNACASKPATKGVYCDNCYEKVKQSRMRRSKSVSAND